VNLQSFLELFAQGAIVLLAIIVLRQWALWRDRVSLDILMVFGSLALVVVLTSASRLAAYETRWLDPIAIAVFLAHPYLLMRVVSHFRPVPATVQHPELQTQTASPEGARGELGQPYAEVE